MKILMVCLGNICRSPLAEGILKNKIEKLGLNWTVDSAGTGNYHIGAAPHLLSQKVARLNDIDICRHQARQFTKYDMRQFNKIYVMDADNYNEVKRISQEFWDETKTELLLNEVYTGENRGVPDPWFGKEDGYHLVYKMMDMACNAIVEKYAPSLKSESKRENTNV